MHFARRRRGALSSRPAPSRGDVPTLGPEWLRASGAFEDQLRRLWFDCHVHSPGALTLLTEMVGSDRLVFGTNFAGWDSGARFDTGPLDDALSRNACALLRLEDAVNVGAGTK